MKKLTLTISILLLAGITAQAMRYLPNQNKFRRVINYQYTNNWNEKIRTISLYNSHVGIVIYHGEGLEMELYGSSPYSSIKELIQIKKETKMNKYRGQYVNRMALYVFFM